MSKPKDSVCYFPPAGGGWNLVHICRLLPESHALFLTPVGCARVIALSAVEAGLQDRFSFMRVTEQELVAGGLEEKTIQAAREVIRRRRPKALFLFTCCISDFIGMDRESFFKPLREEFPDVLMLDARMDPINRENGMPPLVRMQNVLNSALEKDDSCGDKSVLVSGSFWPPEEGQELLTHLRAGGIAVKHLYHCTTFAEARSLGNAGMNLVLHPTAVPAAKALEARLGIPWVNLFPCGTEEALAPVYQQVCQRFGLPPVDLGPAGRAVEQAAETLRKKLNGRFVDVDDVFAPNTAMLVQQLQSLDIPVRRAYLDGGGALPGVQVIDAGDPEFAFAYSRGTYADPEAVCAGELAAYADHSRHFVSGLRFSGRFGLDGLRRTLEELTEAADATRPLEKIGIPGRGCFGR